MTDARWPGWPFQSSDPRVVPQPAEQQERQLFPATLTVHAPSGPTFACTRHASEIAAVLVCMGATAAMVPAPDGAQCANCINEAKP